MLTTVAVGTPGKAVLAIAANFACANFNWAAVGGLVAAVMARAGVELLVASLDVGRAGVVVGAPLMAGGALLVATPFVGLGEALGTELVLSATTVVEPAGTLTAGAIGELIAALGAADGDSLLVAVV